MAKSFLNQEHERWLFYNFSTKTNEELALMLSKIMPGKLPGLMRFLKMSLSDPFRRP